MVFIPLVVVSGIDVDRSGTTLVGSMLSVLEKDVVPFQDEGALEAVSSFEGDVMIEEASDWRLL